LLWVRAAADEPHEPEHGTATSAAPAPQAGPGCYDPESGCSGRKPVRRGNRAKVWDSEAAQETLETRPVSAGAHRPKPVRPREPARPHPKATVARECVVPTGVRSREDRAAALLLLQRDDSKSKQVALLISLVIHILIISVTFPSFSKPQLQEDKPKKIYYVSRWVPPPPPKVQRARRVVQEEITARRVPLPDPTPGP